MRGKRENTVSIGIMRIDITASCSARVLRVSWLTLPSRRSCSIGSSVLLRCSIMAWVITSSPTRLINWSTLSTFTRIDDASRLAALSAAAADVEPAHAAGVSAWLIINSASSGAATGSGSASKKP